MMRLWPRSLLWRTVLTVSLVLLLVYGAVLALSALQQREALRDSRMHQAAEQIALAVRALDGAPGVDRPGILAGLGGPGFGAALSEEALLHARVADRHFAPMARLLADVIGPPSRDGMVVRLDTRVPWRAFPDIGMMMGERRHHRPGWWRVDEDDRDHDEDEEHEEREERAKEAPHPHAERLIRAWVQGPKLAASVPLIGGGWLNAAVPLNVDAAFWTLPNLRPFFLAGLLLAVISVWAVWRAVRPLDTFARAAERLGRDMDAPALPVKGPAEVRRAANAFNRMQSRIRDFVSGRTRMLAAIAHDLRTPITRMRLRAELMDDDAAREKMLADLEEMEAMVNATLAFARDEGAGEPMQPLNLAATLQAVVDDAADAGGAATYEGPDRLVIEGRALGLKRVFANLVGNAVTYGGSARVTLSERPDGIRITIDDEGAGLPDDQLEAVFQPFQRGESSRSRDTGGVGLGLSVVRAIVTAHGGDVTLQNRPEGGLRARVRLPKA